MDSILNRRPRINNTPVDYLMDGKATKPQGSPKPKPNNGGSDAGVTGAIYSLRNTLLSQQKDKADKDAIKMASKIEEAVAGSRDVLDEIRDSLTKTLREVARSVFRIENKEDKHRGRGTLADEDRPGILKGILEQPRYRTKYQTNRDQALFDRQQLMYKFTKRGIGDMVFGAPKEGSGRKNQRDYEDALKQYQSDRMILQGKTLTNTYGSKRGAEKQIAKDFAEQQKLKREISTANKEVERRRKAGWSDADIDSDAAGNMLSKLKGLTDAYAKHDPTNTGRYLEQAVDPKAKPNRPLPSERFNAGAAVHKDYIDDTSGMKGIGHQDVLWKNDSEAKRAEDERRNGVARGENAGKVFKVRAPTSGTSEGTIKEEEKLEADELQKEEIEEVKKQTSLLEKIAEGIGKKDEKVEGYSDGKPEKSFWESLLEPFKDMATVGKGIMKVGSILLTGLEALGPILTGLSTLILPLTAAVGLVMMAKSAKEDIEAHPNAPENKDNAYAMTLRGEAKSVGQAANINRQKALRQLPPGTAAQYIEQGQQDENGLIDGYTMDQLMDMRDGKMPKDLAKTPMELKGMKDGAAAKAAAAAKAGNNKGDTLKTASDANEDAKRDASNAPVTVVAPQSNTTNNVQKSDGAKPMGNVRNPDSGMKKYIDSRYAG